MSHRAIVTALGISIGFNVALSCLSIWHAWNQSGTQAEIFGVAVDSSNILPQSGVVANENLGLQDRVARLRKLHVPEEDIRLFAAGLVSSVSTVKLSIDPRYWRRNWRPTSPADPAAHEQRRERLANELIDVFGDSAVEYPEFADTLKPRWQLFPFLTSEELRRVAMYRAQAQSKRAAGTMADQGYTDILPPDKAIEVLLRESTLASMIRMADTELTEAEYREIFTAFRKEESTGVPLDVGILAKQVPAEKIVAVLAVRNPAFARLKELASQATVSGLQLTDAATALLDATEREQAMAGAGPRMLSAAEAETFRATRAARDAALAKALGPTLAAELIEGLRMQQRIPAAGAVSYQLGGTAGPGARSPAVLSGSGPP